MLRAKGRRLVDRRICARHPRHGAQFPSRIAVLKNWDRRQFGRLNTADPRLGCLLNDRAALGAA